MMTLEQPQNGDEGKEVSPSELQEQLTELRGTVHAAMNKEIEERLEREPRPSEEELRAAAFTEWLEPQVRGAVGEMYRKGYGTASSGFYGEQNDLQAIDGYFSVDDDTRKKIEALGAQILDGSGMGLPMNKLIRQIRFQPNNADLQKIKEKWDAIAAVLPQRDGPPAICDRAEEFREEYAPEHPSLEEARQKYFDFLRSSADKGIPGA